MLYIANSMYFKEMNFVYSCLYISHRMPYSVNKNARRENEWVMVWIEEPLPSELSVIVACASCCHCKKGRVLCMMFWRPAPHQPSLSPMTNQ
jgi:hypothetical protein